MILNGEVLMDTQKQSTKNEEEDPIYPDEVHKSISRPFDRNEYFVN